VNLTGHTVLDIYGVSRVELQGDYSAEQLADELAVTWIPYVECDRKCSRADYCKYTQPSPYHKDRLTDIRCGAVVAALMNFIKSTFHILESLPPQLIEAYLDGAYYLTQFVLSAEHTLGTLANEDAVEWYGKYAPQMFGYVTRLREELNTLAGLLSVIPEFRARRGVLFVEGRTEKAFLQKLKESHTVTFLHLIVETYEGVGNRRPKRIQMLLENYKAQGYEVFIQGDGDGKGTTAFDELVRLGSVEKDCTFVFTHDFESSIPRALLFKSLRDIGELEGVSLEDLQARLGNDSVSVVKLLKDIFALDINSMKLELAEAVASRLNDPWWPWWQDTELMETELGRFLEFVRRVS
jgi:hypothetical protein